MLPHTPENSRRFSFKNKFFTEERHDNKLTPPLSERYMKKLLLLFACLLLFLAMTAHAFAIDYESLNSIAEAIQSETSKKNGSQIYNGQDIPIFGVENPLKGLSKFNFSSRFYASKELAGKVHTAIEKVLGHYGKVDKIDMVVKTDKGDAVDFSKLNAGDSLIYEIKTIKFVEKRFNVNGFL